VAGAEPLELAQEAGLSMVRPAHVGDECRPFVLEARALGATFRVLEER
jgi:hypothetical protein